MAIVSSTCNPDTIPSRFHIHTNTASVCYIVIHCHHHPRDHLPFNISCIWLRTLPSSSVASFLSIINTLSNISFIWCYSLVGYLFHPKHRTLTPPHAVGTYLTAFLVPLLTKCSFTVSPQHIVNSIHWHFIFVLSLEWRNAKSKYR